MTFVQATTGGGGWPMSVWLTPDLKPFVGGTYFPPEDRYGQPGFTKVLERIATAWKENHDKIVEQGGKIVEALRESQSGGKAESKIDSTVLDAAYRQLDRSYDPKEGGFGNAPKFPRPVTLNFLTRFYAREVGHASGLPSTDKASGTHALPSKASGTHALASKALEMTLFTLRKMAAGGNARSHRRRVSSLLGRSLLARAALRKNALRPGATRGCVPRRVSNHG
jgi:hypothetical protein